MPPSPEFILPPVATGTAMRLAPAHNAINSLVLLNRCTDLSGLPDWVGETRGRLSAELLDRNELVVHGLHYAVVPRRDWPSFPDFLDFLAGQPATALRDRVLTTYAQAPPLSAQGTGRGVLIAPAEAPAPDSLLDHVEGFLAHLRSRFPPEAIDEAVERQAFALLRDPPQLQTIIVEHLREMWRRALADEWDRTLPLLQACVEALQSLPPADRSLLELARFITRQPLEGSRWEALLARTRELTFVPSPHLGPYLGKFQHGDRLWLLFGAYQPAGAPARSAELLRSDLLVRLQALADDNRLRILRLIADAGELRSQDIIDRLGLSQSAASRHLKQLSATGYLSERRQETAKLYRLNADRVGETFELLAHDYLRR